MSTPQVAVIMGSNSDWDIMKPAIDMLEKFGIPHEARVISAHRATDMLVEYAEGLRERGFVCAIAGAGGAAHLAGVLAAKTTLPVLGVPVPSKYLKGMDSLLSTVQMPKGIPVATFAIGEAGAANAALYAASIIATTDAGMADKLKDFRKMQEETVRNMTLPPA
ncbi:MAG: 5-(carboxyamino)imidazole ribonucleotide mutase [Pseudomonadota bacterium]|nr:5-(carboxyamino)imidazole ribonucleotide mutase [Pseudomonadota bacterium]